MIRVSDGLSVTWGGCFFGVLSTGAGAIVPWKFWPTTTVAIAPFASVTQRRGSGFTSASPNRFAELRRRRLRLRLRRVVVDRRAEVVEPRRVLRLPRRRQHDLVAALAELVRRIRSRAGDAVAVQHGGRDVLRPQRVRAALDPERDVARLLRRLARRAGRSRARRRRCSTAPSTAPRSRTDPSMRDWKTCPDGSPCAKKR